MLKVMDKLMLLAQDGQALAHKTLSHLERLHSNTCTVTDGSNRLPKHQQHPGVVLLHDRLVGQRQKASSSFECRAYMDILTRGSGL